MKKFLCFSFLILATAVVRGCAKCLTTRATAAGAMRPVNAADDAWAKPPATRPTLSAKPLAMRRKPLTKPPSAAKEAVSGDGQ